MATTLLIGETYLKDNTNIDENVDVKVLRNSILEAQDFRIMPILGTALYNAITTVAPNTWSASYQTLVNTYVKPALKYWVLHDACLELNYKIMNKGILKRSSENTETVALSDVYKLMEGYKIKAEFYSERITKYLTENSTTFTLYEDYGDGIDSVAPKRQNYTQGLYLGDVPNTYNLDVDKGRDNYC